MMNEDKMVVMDSHTRQTARNNFIPANEIDQLTQHHERATINLEDYMQLREEQEVENEAWRIEFEAVLEKERKSGMKEISSSDGSSDEEELNEEYDDEDFTKVLGLQDNAQEAVAFRETMREV